MQPCATMSSCSPAAIDVNEPSLLSGSSGSAKLQSLPRKPSQTEIVQVSSIMSGTVGERRVRGDDIEGRIRQAPNPSRVSVLK